MMLIFLFSLFLLHPPANAGTTVIYFGGYGAGPDQIKCWERGARKSEAHTAYTFRGVPYPAGATGKLAAARAKGDSKIQAIVKEIDSRPSERFIVVGHSSGAALSNGVAELVKHPAQIELVSLDGSHPPEALQKRVRTNCVYAANKKNGARSRNYDSMKGNCRSSTLYEDHHCTTDWCLHYSLANTSVPADLGAHSGAKGCGYDMSCLIDGYKGCATNLSWLAPKRLPKPEASPEPGGSSAQ